MSSSLKVSTALANAIHGELGESSFLKSSIQVKVAALVLVCVYYVVIAFVLQLMWNRGIRKISPGVLPDITFSQALTAKLFYDIATDIPMGGEA